MVDHRVAEVAETNVSQGVSERGLALLWIAVAAAVALHNAEEWLLGMTGWIAEHPWLPVASLHGDQDQFALVLTLVTAAVLALTVTALTLRPRWSVEVLVCAGYVIMANGISHLLLSLLSWSPMPGVFSGTAVLLPLGVILTRALPPVRWTVVGVAMTAVAGVGIIAGGFVVAALLSRWTG